MIEFACPHCQKRFTAKQSAAGHTGSCPGCGGSVRVPPARRRVTVPPSPAADGQDEPETAPVLNVPPTEPSVAVLPVPRRRRRIPIVGLHTATRIAIIGLALGIGMSVGRPLFDRFVNSNPEYMFYAGKLYYAYFASADVLTYGSLLLFMIALHRRQTEG